MKRRDFLKFSIVTTLAMPLGSLVSCSKSYQRKAELINLGQIKSLLLKVQYLRSQSILLFRDDQGWSALNMRCSYEGCDLTYQENSLYCSCCRSHFAFDGRVLAGKAKNNLPFYELSLKVDQIVVDENQPPKKQFILVADTSKIVKQNYRFTTQEIEDALSHFKDAIGKSQVLGNEIPKFFREKQESTGMNIAPEKTESLY